MRLCSFWIILCISVWPCFSEREVSGDAKSFIISGMSILLEKSMFEPPMIAIKQLVLSELGWNTHYCCSCRKDKPNKQTLTGSIACKSSLGRYPIDVLETSHQQWKSKDEDLATVGSLHSPNNLQSRSAMAKAAKDYRNKAVILEDSLYNTMKTGVLTGWNC